ncbi:MAG: helix-turn-helix transcriptional regulator [Rhodobacterales bacterium]|nr:helix-turn-helix transcriptional regulator [Rhodobacterales bacterium]
MRSPCPIASALDLIGDKWTLLVVRDLMFFGKSRYGEFLDSPEGIATNILADRLRRLEDGGIVVREGAGRRHDYRLTDKGEALRPVLKSLIDWGLAHIPGVATEPPPDYRG